MRMAGKYAWRRGRIAAFLILTFALSWGYDAAIAVSIGHSAWLELGMAPWSMFVPALVALSLQLFAYPDSPLYVRRGWDRAHLIPVSYLALALLYGVVTLLAVLLPSQRTLLGGLGNLLPTLWTLALFALHGQVGKEGFERAGTPLGDLGRGLGLGLGVVGFLLAQNALNLALRRGVFPGVQERLYGIAVPPPLYPVALVLGLALSATGMPLAGLAPTFGEEYAWRGVLYPAWIKVGKRRAALLVGLVWGAWHVPVVLSGIHTYPPTALGLCLALAFFALWGVVQSYAVLKTGSVWVAAFTHGLVNSVYGFGLTYLARPVDKVWSFGLGVYGLLGLIPIALFLLRDRDFD
jgi:membrane protease YdiL (CAAX protease family)